MRTCPPFLWRTCPPLAGLPALVASGAAEGGFTRHKSGGLNLWRSTGRQGQPENFRVARKRSGVVAGISDFL